MNLKFSNYEIIDSDFDTKNIARKKAENFEDLKEIIRKKIVDD